ncbi:conserved hypothetical protein [Frankia canadensis]|uniref:Uncharacterized protein n=1 Tax=Frankia canadensis TaxID=1836972 RepID=A0A2I2KKN9_9ACTN|nr:hypothetical protein [Frankia canadensis]SNQ46242.1 conserved hypothetical protein [Frankia canadensis]SOU53532.1 conserved hypothetical protein [Frankia canadensis]
MTDNVMYDSPNEFMQDVANNRGLCVAQSVLPQEDGTYLVECACETWTTTASSIEEGLRLAKAHTSSAA